MKTCSKCNSETDNYSYVNDQVVCADCFGKHRDNPLPKANTSENVERVTSPSLSPPDTQLQAEGACPLCGQTKHMQKAQYLYDHIVCKKCSNGFAIRRQFAFVLDVIGWILLMYAVIYLYAFAYVFDLLSVELNDDAFLYVMFAIFLCKDCFSGHSLGKRMCGIKVIDEETGSACGIGMSIKRNLPLVIPLMVFFVGIQLYKGHRTGDGWSRSMVIWKKYADHPFFAPTIRRGELS